MEKAVVLCCAKCGSPDAAQVAGVVMCAKCREEWSDFLAGLEVAKKLSGIGPVSVRLPSGKLYRLQGGKR